MKIPRCVREYRNYVAREIKDNNLIDKDVKRLVLDDLDRCVWACERGLISVSECMKKLSE